MRTGAIALALVIVAACGSSQLAEAPAESMSPGAAVSGLNVAANATAPAFPLHVSANGRYLFDQQDTPFRIHGYALWSLISMIASPGDLSSLLTSLSSIGVNTLYVTLSDHDSEGLIGRTPGQGPRDAAGDYPFLEDTSGRVYAGTGYTGGFDAEGDTTGPTNITADMSTTNANYFSHLDSVLAACQSAAFLVLLSRLTSAFGQDEGWAADMTASGASKVTAFGTFVGNRYKNQSNVIWMAYGDVDPGTLTGMQAPAPGHGTDHGLPHDHRDGALLARRRSRHPAPTPTELRTGFSCSSRPRHRCRLRGPAPPFSSGSDSSAGILAIRRKRGAPTLLTSTPLRRTSP